MKRLIILTTSILCICFLIPIFFTTSFQKKEVNAKEGENTTIITPNNYDYTKYNTIKLLHTKTGQVEEIKLDEYLYGVVSSEMPVDFALEALKAQAVVARTYTIYKILNNSNKHEGADICDNSTCCQAWISKEDRLGKWEEAKREENWNKIVESVNSTQGKIITYEGKPINAFFHSNSGGTTEAPINVWGGSDYPYLQSVTTAGEDAYSQYSSEATITKDELIQKMKEKYQDFEIDFNQQDAIKILEYTEGNRVKTIKIGNQNLSGVEVRTLFKLRSANFAVSIDENNVTFEVTGYGHGVGLSQTGADSLAKEGKNYEEIIKHFYTGVEITNL